MHNFVTKNLMGGNKRSIQIGDIINDVADQKLFYMCIILKVSALHTCRICTNLEIPI
jgi:hypothetical protein